MANLVKLLLDKDTGTIVAQNSLLPAGFFETMGYIFEQDIPSTTWSISHGADSFAINVQIYDDDGIIVMPDNIEVIDNNNIEISFVEAQSGKAFLIVIAI